MPTTRARSIALFLAFWLLSAALPAAAPLAVSAGSASAPSVLSEPDARVLSSVLEYPEDDFNHATVDWTVTGGRAEAVTSLSEAPYTAFEGSRSLLLTCLSSDGTVSIEKTPSVFTATGGARFFAAAVWIPASLSEATASLTLTVGSETFSRSVTLLAGRWQAVFFDLAGAPKGDLASISLSLTAPEDGYSALLDCLGAAGARARFTVRYLTESYRAENCLMTGTASETLSVVLTGQPGTLEAEAPVLTDFSGGVGLRVRLLNRSDCRSLTLFYTTLLASEYTDRYSYTVEIPAGDGVVSCLFPIPESYIGRFRLAFDGAPSGTVEILSVSASPCYTVPSSVGAVTECLVSRDRKSLSVKGTVPEEDVLRYKDATVCLYELSLWEDPSAVTTARQAAAESPLSGTEFSFTLPLSADGNELYRKYAVMIYYAGGLIPVGQARAVTNPERLAEASAVAAPASNKGFWPLSGNYLFDGLSFTVEEIRLEELVTLGTSSVVYPTGEGGCAMDAEFVENLDRRMANYESCGIRVCFLLRVSRSNDISLNRLLCHPLASGGRYAAFNTASAEGVSILRAVTAFLTERYASSSGRTRNLTGFLVGADVNDAYDSYNLGRSTLQTAAKAYANAFRVVYNAARSIHPSASVYLPLGGAWYSGLTADRVGSFDARSMLEAVAACLEAGGPIHWQLSYDAFPEKGSYAWEIADPDLSSEADGITAANLEVLMNALSEPSMLDNGVARTVILTETGPYEADDENERIRLSADYVYTCLRLTDRRFASVEALIPAHPVDYNGTLTYLDTNRFPEVSAFAAELIGESRFESLLPDVSRIVQRNVTENAAVTVIPSDVKGEKPLFDFSSGTDGWRASLNCASLKGGTSLEGHDNLLSLRLEDADPDVWRGAAVTFDQPLDLSMAPYLGFELRSAVLPDGVDKLTLAVAVYAGRNLQVSTLTVPAASATTVVADLSAFPGRSACEGMAIYVRSADGAPIGEPTLLIGSVRAMSTQLSGSDLDRVIRSPETADGQPTVRLATLLAIGGLGLLALLLESVRLLRRRAVRRTDEESGR